MSERDRAGKTYFCVAWESESCGGFDWYSKQDAADRAYMEEKLNESVFAPENWKAYRFNVELPATMTPDEITRHIDENLQDYIEPLK